MKNPFRPGCLLLPMCLFCAICLGADGFSSRDLTGTNGKTTDAGADGLDVEGNLRLVYREVRGDFDIRARVQSFLNVGDKKLDNRAGVTVRQALDHTCMMAQAGIRVDSKFTFVSRSVKEGKAEITVAGTARPPDAWVRLARKGAEITAYTASDKGGKYWEQIGVVTIHFADPVMVGLQVSNLKTQFRDVALESSSAPVAKPTAGSAAEPEVRAQPASTARAPEAPAPAGKADREMAFGLSAGAAKLAEAGKYEKAQEMCFKALSYDDSAPVALYELGKLLERDGQNLHAGNFLARAAQELTRQEGQPGYAGMLMDAERRLQKLNPHANRMADLFADYSADLAAAMKRYSDTITQEEAIERVRVLKLAKFVPADKLPKLDHAVAKARGTSVPPEIERALKSAGWQTISGAWKKKAENVYEVADGKLEANYANGALQVTIHKGGGGSVKAMVRNSHREFAGTYSSYASGYGVKVESANCELFTPYSTTLSNSNFRPWLERSVGLPDALPKTLVVITIQNGAMEIHVNGKKEKAFNYNINKDGPFIIHVDGTATLESPMAKGQ